MPGAVLGIGPQDKQGLHPHGADLLVGGQTDNSKQTGASGSARVTCAVQRMEVG